MKTESMIQKGALVLVTLAVGAFTALPGRAQLAAQPASALTIPTAQLMQPEELQSLLQKPQALKPLIVGLAKLPYLLVKLSLVFNKPKIKG